MINWTQAHITPPKEITDLEYRFAEEIVRIVAKEIGADLYRDTTSHFMPRIKTCSESGEMYDYRIFLTPRHEMCLERELDVIWFGSIEEPTTTPEAAAEVLLKDNKKKQYFYNEGRTLISERIKWAKKK